MTGRCVEIVPCPPAMSRDALALALSDLTPEQRREFAPTTPGKPVEALIAALEGGKLCGAAWGQRQPGSTAILWPPRMTADADPLTASRLACAAAAALDAAGIRMIQVLLSDHNAPIVPILESAGFARLSELLYLSWEAAAPPVSPAATLEFEPFHDSQRDRLVALIEKTYEATQDCAALNGKRPMDEVLDGYRATGTFRPENWLIVRSAGQDVGALLLADHCAANHWELLYMGLVPNARGHHFGCDIVRHAQLLAQAAGVERIVLAVDAENLPAIKMYNKTGFTVWDRRTVFVRCVEEESRKQKSP
jgi:ribosomal protein S18 acetylase RimI-like enzyme